MMKKKAVFIFLIFLIILGIRVSGAEETTYLMQKINDNEYHIGNITILIAERMLSFPAEFNMENGLIELLLCGSRGKLHESVLKTEIIPSHLQVALLLLDFNYLGGLEYQGEDRQPQGDSLSIRVKWKAAGKEIDLPIEKLAYNIKQNKEMEETHWIFSGSKIVEGNFMADLEQSIITTYHDPYTIIDNPGDTGADDTLYEVNESLVPEKGTPAMITITEFKKK